MVLFFDSVTELVLSELSDLTLKVFCPLPDNRKDGVYLNGYQVDINGHCREVSSDKYFNIAARLCRPIELHVFTGGCFSGVVLTPLEICSHVRLVFMKHKNGKVLVTGIAKADLPNASGFMCRRGFAKLFHRDACYKNIKMRFIVGSSIQQQQLSLCPTYVESAA